MAAPSDLARWAAARHRADGEARSLAREAAWARAGAAEARIRAERALQAAAAGRARADALARGKARWLAAVRLAREATLEREAEEVWPPP